MARGLCDACYKWFHRHPNRKRHGRFLAQFGYRKFRWTEAERANALEMVGRGMNYRQVGWVLGRSRQAVQRLLDRSCCRKPARLREGP